MTNITAIRGDDLILTLTFNDGTNIVDITNFKIYFTIKRDTSVTDAEADLQHVYTVVDGSSGVMSVYVPAIETAQLYDKYFYDVEVIDRTSFVTTPIYGSITFIPDSTRATT